MPKLIKARAAENPEEEEPPQIHSVKLSLYSPNNQNLLNADLIVNLESNTRARTILHIDSIPYTVNGIYEFVLMCEEDGEKVTVTSVPLEIIREESEEK